MRIVIFGATGFIGKRLFSSLDKEEYDLTVVSRDAEHARESLGEHAEFVEWDGSSEESVDEIVKGAWAVINLAGESLAGKLWTDKQKEKILHSRINTTSTIVNSINRLESKPHVYIQASAIGYYGSRGNQTLHESDPPGEGFLAEVTARWEEAAREVDNSVRLVLLRTGVVLGPGGGALQPMARPFKFGFGGHIGSGKQWFSWIHLDDEVRAIQFLLENREAHGAYNLTAPDPVKMKTFAKDLARVLKRPAWFHVPAFLIRMVMGQMGKELLLVSQKVSSEKLLEEGFKFQFSDLRMALTNIYNS
ncbi:MAG: TIGR01777 family oxidoreductase [Bacteroidales bacterium]